MDFERKEAVSVAKEIGIPQRSADNYLKILVQQGKIIKKTHGSYRKHN
jgi:predicted transcriptional regulator